MPELPRFLQPTKAKEEHIETPEFVSDKDPRRFILLKSRALHNFLEGYKQLSHIDKTHLLEGIFYRTRGRLLSFKNLTQLSDHDVKQFPTLLPLLAQEHLIQTLMEQRVDFEAHYSDLFEMVEENLDEMFLEIITIDKDFVRIIPTSSINELSAWYTEQAFVDLPATIKRLNAYPRRINALQALGIFGVLYGHLDKNHPNYNQYLEQLSPYYTNVSPRLLRELRPTENENDLDTPRLTNLKGYWHQAFINSWAATARLEYDGIGALSVADRYRTAAQLNPDLRSADSSAGTVSQANSYELRTGVNNQVGMASEYQREQQRAENQARTQRAALIAYTDQLLKSYQPQHTSLYEDQSRPRDEWWYFRQKAGLLFQIFAKHAAYLQDSPDSDEAQEKGLNQLANRLVEAIGSGQDKHRLEVSKLFGADFPNLPAIEKISLIIFTALTLADRRQHPKLAVSLVSHRLETLLQKHHDNIQVRPPTPGTVRDFNPDNYKILVDDARKRLLDLPQSSEVMANICPVLEEVLETRLELLGGYYDQLMDLKEQLDSGKEFYSKLMLFVSLAATSTVSFDVLKIYFEEQLSGAEILAALAAAGVTAFARKEIVKQVERKGLKKLEKEIAALKLTNHNYDEVIAEVTTTKQQAERRAKIFYAMTLLCVVIFALTTSILREYAEAEIEANNDRMNGDMSGEIIETFQPIDNWEVEQQTRYAQPDVLNPESLRRLPHVLEAELLHLPDEFSGAEGEAIAYQSKFWINPDSSLYEDPTVDLFTAVAKVEDINQIEYQADSNDLVVQPNVVYPITRPYDGYRIVQVFQQGGVTPLVGSSGELYFDAQNLPQELVLVQERLPNPTQLDEHGHVWEYPQLQGEHYQPWEGWAEKYPGLIEMNSQLAGDPELQQLHMNMIQRINTLVEEFTNTGMAESEMQRRYSEVAVEYAGLFGSYEELQRYYSLQFGGQAGLGQELGYLEAIANDPDLGYYCLIANEAFQDFMTSINIQVLTKPGATVRNYQDRLLSRIGHMNSVMILPDARLVFTDMTPQRPMPGEDLSALAEIPPNLDKQAVTTEKVVKLLALLAGTSVLAGVSLVSLRRRRQEAEVSERIVTMLSKGSSATEIDRQNPEATSVLEGFSRVLEHLISTADESQLQKFVEHFGSRENFYQSLAHDLVSFIKRGRAATQSDLSWDKYFDVLKNTAEATEPVDPAKSGSQKQSKTLTSAQSNSVQEALKYIRRGLITEAQKADTELEARINELEKLFKSLEPHNINPSLPTLDPHKRQRELLAIEIKQLQTEQKNLENIKVAKDLIKGFLGEVKKARH